MRKIALLKMNISSYTTNGDSFSAAAADLGFNEVTAAFVSNASASTTAAYLFNVDIPNKKVLVFTATGTQLGAVALDSLHVLIVGY